VTRAVPAARRALAGILTPAVLALVPPASAAPTVGPGQPPAAPGPTAGCKPARSVVCGPAHPLALGSALARYAAARRSDRVRRGLGLPSLRQLFGATGTRAEALADTRLARPSRPAAAARAAGAAALGRVGSVGRVSVEATVAPGIGAGVDQVSYTDRIRGPSGSQTRSIRFTATADSCPIAARGTSNSGTDVGHLLAAEHIVTVQRTGRFEITTDFTLDTAGSRETWGAVYGNSNLGDITPKPTAYTRIRRVRVTRDLRTGRRFREKPLELTYELEGIDRLAMLASDNFDSFIEKYANSNDNDPADAAVPDRLLNSGAFQSAAQTFMLAVGAKTRAVYTTAEKQWKTPNRCVQLQSDAPDHLLPGQSVKVHVAASSKRGDPATNLRANARYAPYKSAGLTVDPFAFVEPDANAAHDFTVTPPSQAWPDSNPQHLQITLYSTGGIGEVDTDFKAQTLPIRYRVLGATFTTHVQASEPGGPCASLGGTSGTTTLTGAVTGPGQDEETNKLDGQSMSGPLSGGIYARAATQISEQISGCDSDSSGHLQACSRSYADVPLPNPFTIGFDIQAPNPASGDATVHWQLIAPGVGDHLQTCGVMIFASIPYDKSTYTMSLAKLLSTDPQTFTYNDSIHLDHDQLGKPASIDYNWSFTITLQRR
jgi:hypothetical protein